LVTGGTLFSGGANFLSDSSHVQLTGTVNLSLQNNNDTIPSLSSNTGTNCFIGTATLTLAANDGGTYTHGGIISGTGNVIKNGDHTAVFASGNTYTGTTTVNAGVLRMSGNERLDDASDLTITGGAVELFGATETIPTRRTPDLPHHHVERPHRPLHQCHHPPTTPALHLKYTSTAAILTTCLADFNDDGTVDFFGYLDFVAAFSSQDVSGDFNVDEVIDFFDYLDFVAAFSTGC